MITDASNHYFLVCFYLERGRETPERRPRSTMRSERERILPLKLPQAGLTVAAPFVTGNLKTMSF